jgi:pilus assembly protein CpaC
MTRALPFDVAKISIGCTRRSAVLVYALLAAPLTWALQNPNAAQTAAPAQLQRPADSVAESPNDLSLNVGKSVIVTSALPIERVSVGFGDVAEATAVNPKEILVNGKAPGETSLILWQQGGGKLFFDVTVQPTRFGNDRRIDTVRRQLRKELPGEPIDVSVEGDLIFLRGRVKDLTAANRALAISSAIGKPVNLLYSTEGKIRER